MRGPAADLTCATARSSAVRVQMVCGVQAFRGLERQRGLNRLGRMRARLSVRARMKRSTVPGWVPKLMNECPWISSEDHDLLVNQGRQGHRGPFRLAAAPSRPAQRPETHKRSLNRSPRMNNLIPAA